MNTKIRHCHKCHKDTIHTFVAKDAMCEGFGIGRVLVAICSLGVSETVGVDRYYQCQECGEIRKE